LQLDAYLEVIHREIEASNQGVDVRVASFEGTIADDAVVAVYISLAKAADLNEDINALQNGAILIFCFRVLLNRH